MEQVIITGMGLVTSLGNSLELVWDKIINGINGISTIENFDTEMCINSLGGEVKGNYEKNTTSRMKSFAVEAIRNCIIDAGIELDDLKQKKSILIMGSSFGSIFQPDASPTQLNDFIKECLEELNLDIPHLTLSSACSSSSDALLIAGDLIKYSNYETVLCGGVDVLDIFKLSGHSGLYTLSPTMCKPFSCDNDGTLLGEGACFLLFESERSLRTNCKVYCKLLGSCNTTDLQNLTAPSDEAEGPINCIKGALASAGKTPEDVAYINAHGSGTVTNDKMEYKVYQEIFSELKTPISSTKGAFGHLLGATGAVEAVMAILAFNYKMGPPTTNCINPKDEWLKTGLIYANKPRHLDNDKVTISVTYGFGGPNTCLVFG